MLRGEKIVLRPFRMEDGDLLWGGIHSKLLNKLTGTHNKFSRDQIDKYIERQVAADDDRRASFVIALPDEGLRGVGEVVINDIDRDNNSANIRIGLFSEDEIGKGYGTEAMRLMVDYGFRELNLHRIELGVYAFNPRAVHVYEKVGFKQEGVLRDALYWDGEYTDEIIMSVLEQEWPGL